uniref:Putative ovule protein n=1 Tax=Solanum chacoense TaxID=4108 RepID=A0A0V0IIL0_SOLCH
MPAKVKGFTWLVIRRACLTQEVLQKKGRQLVPRCFLCNITGETNKHLFLHCKFTTQLWNLFLNITSTSWTMPEHTSDLLSCWIRRGKIKVKSDGGD